MAPNNCDRIGVSHFHSHAQKEEVGRGSGRGENKSWGKKRGGRGEERGRLVGNYTLIDPAFLTTRGSLVRSRRNQENREGEEGKELLLAKTILFVGRRSGISPLRKTFFLDTRIKFLCKLREAHCTPKCAFLSSTLILRNGLQGQQLNCLRVDLGARCEKGDEEPTGERDLSLLSSCKKKSVDASARILKGFLSCTV